MTKFLLVALFTLFTTLFSGIVSAETEDESDSRRLNQYLAEEQQKIEQEAEMSRKMYKNIDKAIAGINESAEKSIRESDELRKLDDQVFERTTSQDPPIKPFVYDSEKVKKMIDSM